MAIDDDSTSVMVSGADADDVMLSLSKHEPATQHGAAEIVLYDRVEPFWFLLLMLASAPTIAPLFLNRWYLWPAVIALGIPSAVGLALSWRPRIRVVDDGLGGAIRKSRGFSKESYYVEDAVHAEVGEERSSDRGHEYRFHRSEGGSRVSRWNGRVGDAVLVAGKDGYVTVIPTSDALGLCAAIQTVRAVYAA